MRWTSAELVQLQTRPTTDGPKCGNTASGSSVQYGQLCVYSLYCMQQCLFALLLRIASSGAYLYIINFEGQTPTSLSLSCPNEFVLDFVRFDRLLCKSLIQD